MKEGVTATVEYHRSIGANGISHQVLCKAIFALMVLICLLIAVMAAVPPVSRDALTHHLYVPKLYIDAGGIVELPWIPFSYYPMNLDLLYAIPLLFGNDILPKYIHFLFAVSTAGLLYRYCTRRFGRIYGLFGGFFFLSIPVVVRLATTVYVDLGLICFTTASLLLLVEWHEQGFPIRKLVLSGIFCGLALGTKYNGMVSFVLLAMMVPILYIRSNQRGILHQLAAVRHALVFSAAALVIFSPWMIRNAVWTGNPVYPLYQQIFEGKIEKTEGVGQKKAVVEDEGQTKIKWTSFNLRSIIYGESKWEIATIPIRVFFQGQDDEPKYFDGVLSPWLILFPLGLLFCKPGEDGNRMDVSNWMFFGFAVFYLLIVYFKQDMRIRYISPIIPPLVVLSVGALKCTAAAVDRRWAGKGFAKESVVTGAAVVCVLATSVPYVYACFQKIDPLPFISGRVDRDSYIQRFRPEYDVYRFANTTLPAQSKILGVFLGDRGYYCDRDIVFSNDLFQQVAMTSNSVTQLTSALKAMGFTHVIVRQDFYDQWMAPVLAGSQRDMVSTFLYSSSLLLFEKSRIGLYVL